MSDKKKDTSKPTLGRQLVDALKEANGVKPKPAEGKEMTTLKRDEANSEHTQEAHIGWTHCPCWNEAWGACERELASKSVVQLSYDVLKLTAERDSLRAEVAALREAIKKADDWDTQVYCKEADAIRDERE